MSSTIPVDDKALLNAQAKAGPAGVEAYEAAKKELAAQQAAAAARAQAEAARRGTPGVAVGGVSAGSDEMYSRRLASMTEAGALAGAQAAARDARMEDYSGAVGQARSLIADQTAQTVAPINAETEYKIKALTRQGQNEVDRINAQMRLDAARAAAAMASASRGGGGGGGGSTKKTSISEGNLSGSMRTIGQSNLVGAAEAAAAAVARAQAEQQPKVRNAMSNLYKTPIGQAMQRNVQSTMSGSTFRTAFTGNPNTGTIPNTIANPNYDGPKPLFSVKPKPLTPTTDPRYARPTPSDAAKVNAENARVRQSVVADAYRRMGGRGLTNPMYADPLRNGDFGAILGPWLDQFTDPYLAAANSRENYTGPTSIGDIERTLYGNPNASPAGNIGDVNWANNSREDLGQLGLRSRDISIAAMKNAAIEAAQQLADAGYDVNETDLMGALNSTDVRGKTGYDVYSEDTYGEDTAEQAQRKMQAYTDRQAAKIAQSEDIDEATAQGELEQFREIVLQQTGGYAPEQIDPNMDPAVMLEIVTDPIFEEARQRALEESQTGMPVDAFETKLRREGYDQNLIAVLKAMFYG